MTTAAIPIKRGRVGAARAGDMGGGLFFCVLESHQYAPLPKLSL